MNESPLAGATNRSIEDHLAHVGTVFREFRNQDSGFVSYGVAVDGRRWFVKHVADGPLTSLRSAIRLHHAVRHPVVVPLVETVHATDGLALVYPWVDGEVLYAPATDRGVPARSDPGSAHARFRAQPVGVILDALDAVYDAHLAVSRARFVAVDFYDGCLLYAFDRRTIRLIDLDEYRPGPFAVDGAPLPGSTRLRPPEHRVDGATSDDRSTVFQLGRCAQVLLDAGDLNGAWRASPSLAAVAARATAADPSRRHASVAAFVDAWRAARDLRMGVG